MIQNSPYGSKKEANLAQYFKPRGVNVASSKQTQAEKIEQDQTDFLDSNGSVGDFDDFKAEFYAKNTYFDASKNTDYKNEVLLSIVGIQLLVDFIKNLPIESEKWGDKYNENHLRESFEISLRSLNCFLPSDILPLKQLIEHDKKTIDDEIKKTEARILSPDGTAQDSQYLSLLKKSRDILALNKPLYDFIGSKTNSSSFSKQEQQVLDKINLTTLKKDHLRGFYNYWDRAVEAVSVTLVERIMIDTDNENWKVTNHIDKKASPQEIVRGEINKWFYTHPFFEGIDEKLQDNVIASIKKVSPDFTRAVLHFDPAFTKPQTVNTGEIHASEKVMSERTGTSTSPSMECRF